MLCLRRWRRDEQEKSEHEQREGGRQPIAPAEQCGKHAASPENYAGDTACRKSAAPASLRLSRLHPDTSHRTRQPSIASIACLVQDFVPCTHGVVVGLSRPGLFSPLFPLPPP